MRQRKGFFGQTKSLDLKGSQSILQYSERLETVINITNLNPEQFVCLKELAMGRLSVPMGLRKVYFVIVSRKMKNWIQVIIWQTNVQTKNFPAVTLSNIFKIGFRDAINNFISYF